MSVLTNLVTLLEHASNAFILWTHFQFLQTVVSLVYAYCKCLGEGNYLFSSKNKHIFHVFPFHLPLALTEAVVRTYFSHEAGNFRCLYITHMYIIFYRSGLRKN